MYNNSSLSLLFLLLLLLLLLFLTFPSTSLADRYITRGRRSSYVEPQEYVDPTFPSLLLPTGPPSCSLPLLHHDFANTYGSPPVSVAYSPPSHCPAPWSRVVLDLSVSCAGDQYDRIAAVWFGGVEVLRTSTAEPTENGVFWRVRKDVTRYESVFRRSDGGNVSMMLENLVNDVFTGIYHVNVSLDFYPEADEDQFDDHNRRMSTEETAKAACLLRRKGRLGLGFLPHFHSPYEKSENLVLSSVDAGNPVGSRVKIMPTNEDPADLILPISNQNGSNGFWFRIQNMSDVHSSSVKIPLNTYRAVLEIYFSFHSNDEFWYSNPPNSYIEKNNLTTGRGNGAFRQVFATIDGRFVGSVMPFPVIFTGGINPLFWAPVVAIGAFDLPSYILDVTPFLGLLLDGKPHEFGLGVTDGISFWLVDANLHLWLDSESFSIKAKLTQYQAPPISVVRNSKFFHLNGTFKIEAERKVHFSGWVNSSLGNLTTDVNHKLKFKNSIVFLNNGNYKEVHMKAKAKMGVKIREDQELVLSQVVHKSKYPLLIVTSTLAGENNTYTSRTNLSHTFYEESSSLYGDRVVDSKVLTDKQDADGWMLVQDHSVLSGSAGTRQTYHYRDSGGCYTRKVSARDGELLNDSTTTACPPPPS